MPQCSQQVDQLLRELFEDSLESHQQTVPDIPGLTFIPECFMQHQQELLLQQIAAAGWFPNASSIDASTNSQPNSSTAEPQGSTHGTDGCQSTAVANSSSSSSDGRRSNQVMVFGVNNMPPWLQHLGQQLPLRESWPQNLSERSPLFDTAIVNLYEPGDGITPHVDLLRFSDGIAIVSLGDPAIINFTPAAAAPAGNSTPASSVAGTACDECIPCCTAEEQQQTQQKVDREQQPQQQPQQGLQVDGQSLCEPILQDSTTCTQPQSTSEIQLQAEKLLEGMTQEQRRQRQQAHQLLLQSGDVLLLHGEARYKWCHGIAAVKEEVLFCSSCRARLSVTAAVEAGSQCTQQHLSSMDICSKAAGEVGCEACIRITRGRRVSVTLRRLDSAQSVLSMQ